MKNDKLYLLHISECLDRIDRYVSEGAEQFMKDTKTQDAVLRNLSGHGSVDAFGLIKHYLS
jgi:uncharacterized protein with HEPN domain